ncbi:MAG TPA: PP2C family protein-serine/threonine phosphatase [Candidatus Acidoferrales bacterium]
MSAASALSWGVNTSNVGAAPSSVVSYWAKVRLFASKIKTSVRRAFWKSKEGWRKLTAGMEIHDLWTQFKSEAHASSRLYGQDVDWHAVQAQKSWKQPFKIFGYLFKGILSKLSPPRRVFLLINLILATLSILGISFLFITREVEIVLAFIGMLILVIMTLGDHVSMKRDIEIAREIQRWLVPRVPPDVPGVDMAFATRPANTVAGDYYDAFRRPGDGPLLIAVADVSGKSVPAAMLMANFQASLRALAGARSSLSELVTDLNRLACGNNLNGRRFTTAFLAELDPASGQLSYLSAGHNPPVLLRLDGTVERLKSESIPLGIELNEKYKAGTTVLQPNELLVIYTDGVTEAQNERGEQFGESRLLAMLQPRLDERASATLAGIMKNLDDFVGPADQHDDITCLVVTRT